MSELLEIRPYRETDREPLVKNAAADNHSGVYTPTFVIEKGGEIVGYLSMAVPVVLSWQDSKKMNAADFRQEIGFITGALSSSPFVCLPCDPDSPYHKSGVLTKAGFVQYTKPVILYIKERK